MGSKWLRESPRKVQEGANAPQDSQGGAKGTPREPKTEPMQPQMAQDRSKANPRQPKIGRKADERTPHHNPRFCFSFSRWGFLLGPSWTILRPSQSHLGPSQGHLEPSRGPSQKITMRMRRRSGRCWVSFGGLFFYDFGGILETCFWTKCLMALDHLWILRAL